MLTHYQSCIFNFSFRKSSLFYFWLIVLMTHSRKVFLLLESRSSKKKAHRRKRWSFLFGFQTVVDEYSRDLLAMYPSKIKPFSLRSNHGFLVVPKNKLNSPTERPKTLVRFSEFKHFIQKWIALKLSHFSFLFPNRFTRRYLNFVWRAHSMVSLTSPIRSATWLSGNFTYLILEFFLIFEFHSFFYKTSIFLKNSVEFSGSLHSCCQWLCAWSQFIAFGRNGENLWLL